MYTDNQLFINLLKYIRHFQIMPVFKVYDIHGQLLTSIDKLQHRHQSQQCLKQFICRTNNIYNIENIIFFDFSDQCIKQNLHCDLIKFAVVVQNGISSFTLKSQKIYIRKTNKIGIVLTVHLFTTVAQLKHKISTKIKKITFQEQLLIYQGIELNDNNKTLLELFIKPSKIIHLVHLNKSHRTTQFKIYYQTAELNSPVYQLFVTSSTKFKQLKQLVSSKFDIPLNEMGIYYCGAIFKEQQCSLQQLHMIEQGCFIMIIDIRNGIIINKSQRLIELPITISRRSFLLKNLLMKYNEQIFKKFPIRLTKSLEFYQSQNSIYQEGVMNQSFEMDEIYKCELQYSDISFQGLLSNSDLDIPIFFSEEYLLSTHRIKDGENNKMMALTDRYRRTISLESSTH